MLDCSNFLYWSVLKFVFVSFFQSELCLLWFPAALNYGELGRLNFGEFGSIFSLSSTLMRSFFPKTDSSRKDWNLPKISLFYRAETMFCSMSLILVFCVSTKENSWGILDRFFEDSSMWFIWFSSWLFNPASNWIFPKLWFRRSLFLSSLLFSIVKYFAVAESLWSYA